MKTRGTPRAYTTTVKLHRDELATIIDVLANERDPFGEEASDLEVRLAQHLRDADRLREQQLGLRS